MSLVLRPDAIVSDGEISQAECAVRVDLTAVYRLIALSGQDDLVHTHLSAIVPGKADRFPINVFGLAFDEIITSNLTKISGRGQLVGDWPEGAARPSVNVTGFALHAAAHAIRPDAQYVVRLRNTAGVAISAQKHELLLLSQYALCFHWRIAYHDYEGLTFTLEEGMRLTASFGNHFAMLSRNHDTLVIGRIVAETHILVAVLIKTCEVQIQIQIQARISNEVVPPAPHVADRVTEQLEDGDAIEGVIGRPALLRKLNKIDASHRDQRD